MPCGNHVGAVRESCGSHAGSCGRRAASPLFFLVFSSCMGQDALCQEMNHYSILCINRARKTWEPVWAFDPWIPVRT